MFPGCLSMAVIAAERRTYGDRRLKSASLKSTAIPRWIVENLASVSAHRNLMNTFNMYRLPNLASSAAARSGQPSIPRFEASFRIQTSMLLATAEIPSGADLARRLQGKMCCIRAWNVG